MNRLFFNEFMMMTTTGYTQRMQITVKTTLGKLLDLVGEDKVKTFLEEKAAAASYKAEYENNPSNIIKYWEHLVLFIFGFALLAMITLEFIDKDKR